MLNDVIERVRSPKLREQLLDIVGQVQNLGVISQSKVYYVWKGGDDSTGENWARAFTTIAGAIAAHKAYRATQTYKSVNTYILIAPETYEENIVDLPYSCTMIGLGVLGTDKATEIHPVVGSCMAGTVSGLRMYNISFQGGTGTADTLDFNICNNVHIEGCEFYPGAVNSNAAISTQNCGMSVFRNNWILTQAALYYTYGFYFGGGADKYCIANKVEDNLITGLAETGTGIHVAADCTCSGQTIFRNNVIRLSGAGTGIADLNDGVLCIQNKIFTIGGTGLDANEDLAIDNFHNNGTTTVHYPSQTD